MDVGDVARGSWIGGARDLREGGEIEAIDVGGGRVRGAEVVGHGPGAAADVEEALWVGKGGVDYAVVHKLCEAGGLFFEAGMLDRTRGVKAPDSPTLVRPNAWTSLN